MSAISLFSQSFETLKMSATSVIAAQFAGEQIYLRVQEMHRASCPREHAIADDAALILLVRSKIVVSLASRQ